VVQVTLTGGAEHPAKIVGFDEDRDVAVLQLIIEDGDLVSITPPVCYTRVCSKRGFCMCKPRLACCSWQPCNE